MNPNRSRAFVLIGPTASGKSVVAQYLAKQMDTTVVSADSMKIYRGMNVGTAKPSPTGRGAVDFYGMDLVSPTQSFSVGDWLTAIQPAFRQKEKILHSVECDIAKNPSEAKGGRVPIVEGGTGLYVKCLLQGLNSWATADATIRRRVEKLPLVSLQAKARTTAPEAYAALADKENPRRLIRLLEKVPMLGIQQEKIHSWTTEQPTILGLHVERNVLHRRIVERVKKMYAEGLLEEARHFMSFNLSVTAQHAIGYAEAFSVLRGEMTETAAQEQTVIRTRQLAKRQMTWFRNQFCVDWIDTAAFGTIEALAKEVFKGWENNGAVLVKGV